eukprot:269613_1
MPFEESNNFNTWEFNLITNKHKITGKKYIPPQTKHSTRPKDSLSLTHTNDTIPTRIPQNVSKTASKNWREFNIVSNNYYKQNKHKRNIDKLYEYRNSLTKLYHTNPYDPVTGKWKQPKKENAITTVEHKDKTKRINTWNKSKENNFIHHRIIYKQKPNANDIREHDSAKHPEVYHNIQSIKTIKHKNRINPQIYERPLKRNHHIITNQPWKGSNSIDFPLGELKLKHPVLWKR